MSNTYLSKEEVEKILDVMNKFPQDRKYRLEYTTHGIGSCLDIFVNMSVKGQEGEFKIELTSSEDW